MRSKLPFFSGTVVLSSITMNSACSLLDPVINPIKHYCTQQECGSGLESERDIVYCTTSLTNLERKAKYFSCEDNFKDFLDCKIKLEKPSCPSDFDSRDDWQNENGSYYDYYGYYSNSDECDREAERLSDCISRFYNTNTEDTGDYFGYYEG